MEFLSDLLATPDGEEVLKALDENYDEKIVNCLLLRLLDLGSSEEVLVASELIFSTPKMRVWVSDVPACPFAAYEMLIQHLANEYTAAKVSR